MHKICSLRDYRKFLYTYSVDKDMQLYVGLHERMVQQDALPKSPELIEGDQPIMLCRG